MTLRIGKAQKWWEKGIQPNMREVTSAQDLVDSLLNAGDKLVVVDFFSPGCGGCKALHPKVLFFTPLVADSQISPITVHDFNHFYDLVNIGSSGSDVCFYFLGYVVLQICQLAEMNPDVQFLQVNYEDHKSMCYSLNVHVLPFFRFYRGAHGRLCQFSCTNATVSTQAMSILFHI